MGDNRNVLSVTGRMAKLTVSEHFLLELKHIPHQPMKVRPSSGRVTSDPYQWSQKNAEPISGPVRAYVRLCAHLASQGQLHSIRGLGGRPRLALKLLPRQLRRTSLP
jgi:hypothetical protein